MGDPVGFLLERLRGILGQKAFLVCTLDLHAVVTPRMLRNVDGVAAYETYPHIDAVETGRRGAKLLLRLLKTKKRPSKALLRIPALVRVVNPLRAAGRWGGRQLHF